MKLVFSLFVFSLFVLAVLAVVASAARASSIPVGDLEFNSLFPGVNDFTVDNFTGSNNLGAFPVSDNVTFDNSVLIATESDGTVLTLNLGNIGPGSNMSAQVADTLLFTQATFTATLNPDTFTLTNGMSGTFAADPSLSFTLLPSSGNALVAGVDLGIMNASPPSQPSPTPEPGTVVLVGEGVGFLAAFGSRRWRTCRPTGDGF